MPARARAEAPASGLISFADGDQLRGRLLSMTPGAPAAFLPDGGDQIAQLDMTTVARIEFAPKDGGPPADQAASGAEDGNHVLRFHDSTVLTGSVAWIDDAIIALSSSPAGPLHMPREQLVRLSRRLPDPNVIVSGPEAAWELTNQGENWSFHQGALYSNDYSSTALQVELPRKFLFEFDLSTKGQVNLNVSVGAPDKQNLHTDAYLIQVTSHSVNLRRHARRERGSANYSLFSHHHPQPVADSSEPSPVTRYQIFFDFDLGQISLFRNGGFIGSGSESEGFTAPAGNIVSFTSFGGGRARVSRIRLTEWNGAFPEPAPSNPPTQESVSLMNGDILSGRLEGLREGLCAFHTAFAALQFPFSEIRELTAPPPDPSGAARPFPEAVALLRNGDRVTLSQLRIDEESIAGTSALAGTIRLPRETVRSIEFPARSSRPSPVES
ncbi:MAG TPA: hypothetical protein VMN36_06095 [Verrucomicrobiales bacterium]|nr:hypothetical protein [Verrucomicrobiales bacterium]